MNLRRFLCALTSCEISLARVLSAITAIVAVLFQGKLRVISTAHIDNSEGRCSVNYVKEKNLFDFDPK